MKPLSGAGCAASANTAKREAWRFRAAYGTQNMVTSSGYLEAPRWLRAFVRAHETSLVALAALVGVIGGLVGAAMGAAVEGVHVVLFNIEMGARFSSQFRIEPARALLVPSLGGFLLGLTFLVLLRWRPAREID